MPTGPYRLSYGGQIDRTRRIAFRFNGRIYQGHPGDTLASALLANGVRVVARSFKFRRPRGIFSSGVEEPHALVQMGEGAETTPNVRAPLTELTQHLSAKSQEGWPSVQLDVGRVLDAVASLWAAGFYNKTFISPDWHTYEGIIRRLAGLGRAPELPDPDRYEFANLHCDVLVVGGGAAGLASALAHARTGARVVVAERDCAFGASASWGQGEDWALADRSAAYTHVLKLLQALSNVRLMLRTTVTAAYDHQVFGLLERGKSSHPGQPREQYWIARTRKVVLATGAIEQPLIFDHNDRPGVMLAGAVREYLRRFGVAVGSQVVIATNNDSAYLLAADLKRAGIRVPALIESRKQRDVPDALQVTLRREGIDWFPSSMPTRTSGFGKLTGVTVGCLSSDGGSVAPYQTFKCDALAVSGGWAPALQLYAQSGGKLAFDESSGVLDRSSLLPGMEVVGFAAETRAAGPRVSPVGHRARQWVDLLHDVTVADLELALRENYTHIEHVKRYTTVGMGADQGKTATAASLEVMGRLRKIRASELGHTTLRPPVTPVTLGAIAGREIGHRFAPYRQLPMHEWHIKHGALMQDYGEWRRPTVYLRANETRDNAVRREAREVRTRGGLFDGSPLGKIEIRGPDAITFINRFYINDLATLKPYRLRYGLMLRETGVLFDDGTVVVMAPDRILLTTTSGNAGRVAQWLEEWHQCEWPDLRVAMATVTECWATISIAGPNSRSVLSKLPGNIDFSPEGFPHLSLREGVLLGFPARIYRVSFTGELAYEVNVPAEHGVELWEALSSAGALAGVEPFGMDALLLLRLEKGFIHLGTDTDGTTIPDDVGFGKVAANKKADFIGQRSLMLPEHRRPDRLQLIGLVSEGRIPFLIGSHLRVRDSQDATDGWVTSAGLGALTGDPIALAMLRRGRSRLGEIVDLYDGGRPIGTARIVAPCFYDPSGDRMNA